MIRAVLGVDGEQRYLSALDLLARLNLPQLHVHAAFVAETVKAFRGLPRPWQVSESLESIEDSASAKLAGAHDGLVKRGIEAEEQLLFGNAAKALLEFSDTIDADLIVVGSERKGRWGSLFMGSVTRTLAMNACQSFLVGKGEKKGEGPIHAVLATDHSEYCQKCSERLLEWGPKGIGKLTIMTAHWTDISMLEMALRVSNLDPDELYDWVTKRIESKNQELADRFEAAGIPCEVRVLENEPRDAIASTMQETGADLLILGAQGHGFVERCTVGSVAMHEVVASPHSTLVVRA